MNSIEAMTLPCTSMAPLWAHFFHKPGASLASGTCYVWGDQCLLQCICMMHAECDCDCNRQCLNHITSQSVLLVAQSMHSSFGCGFQIRTCQPTYLHPRRAEQVIDVRTSTRRTCDRASRRPTRYCIGE